MKDRIKMIMDELHLTQQSFSNATGISTPTLSNILSGKTKATLNVIEAIKKKFPHISTDWLLYGIGPMYTNSVPQVPTSTSQEQDAAEASGLSPVLPFEVEDEVSPEAPQSSSTPNTSYQKPSNYEQGSLFDQSQTYGVRDTRKNVTKTEIKYVDKAPRKITEIRIFYDDQTWETFVPKK